MSAKPKTPNPAPPKARPGWGECPPAELPLRRALPAFRRETEKRLLQFGAGQTFLGGWLCDRGEAYFKANGECLPTNVCMAVACLDLLAWQSGGLADVVALSRLPTDAELNWTKPAPKI